MKIRYDIWQYFKQRLEKINSISRITDFKEIEAIKTNDKCCVNCIGHGNECEQGGAWIYCDIRAEHEEKFDGDCGEGKGCQMFSDKKA